MYSRFKNIRQFFLKPADETSRDTQIDLGSANVNVIQSAGKVNSDGSRLAAIKLFSTQSNYSSGEFLPEESTYPQGTVLCCIQ
jgi:hypothetical protein